MNLRVLSTAAALTLAAAGLATPARAATSPATRPAPPGIQLPAGASHGPDVIGAAADEVLTGVSCMAVGHCLAVGYNGSATLAEQWNGAYWRVIEPAQPGVLDGVSCVSSGCLAVGGAAHALAQWWNGRSWRTVNPPAAAGLYLDGADCLSATYCLAVGGNGQNASAIWNGRGWRMLNTPNIGGPDSTLEAVSCTSPSACLAVGWGMPDDEESLATALSWNGILWTPLDIPPENADFDSSLTGVSCLASGCLAVGSGGGSSGNAPLALSWSGGTWTELTPLGSGAFGGVSCLPGGDCIATGQSRGASAEPAAAQEWTGSSWIDLGAAQPDSQLSMLSGVSCPAPADCVAVGSYLLGSGAQLALAQTWDGRTWQLPANPGYLELQSDGSVSNFGASWYGSPHGSLTGGVTAVAVAADPQTGGYWVLTSDGGVDNYHAPWYGSERAHPNGTPVAIAADPVTGGYWILNSNGGVDNYDAPWPGSDRGRLGGAHAVGLAAAVQTAGPGYWILTSDGGIDAFGAPWLGSERSMPGGTPVSLAGDPAASGYWILNGNGTLARYGDTVYQGTVPGPAVAIARDPAASGYWIMTPDGGITSFGAPWFGSLAKQHPPQPPVGLTAG